MSSPFVQPNSNGEPTSNGYHEPVLVAEALEGLAVQPGGAYLDCTLGDAGHTLAIIEASAPDGRVLGLDADPEGVASARARLSSLWIDTEDGGRAVLVQANFATLEAVAAAHGFAGADGVLFDLGLSSRQLDIASRGFSFRRAEPLDMRFDPTLGPEDGPTAAELVNETSERELADIIYQLGEEPRSRRIARGIAAHRPIADTAELAEVVRRASGYPRGRTHPATRTFQALRMTVNQELENLRAGLEQAVRVLRLGGRLVTIAYHSLEDRVVKEFFAAGYEGIVRINKKVLKPSQEEVRRNRRSRSARMRIAERT